MIVEASVALVAGANDDFYGLFLRQSQLDAFYTFAVSPAGQCVIASYDGAYHELVNGMLAPDMTFHHGVDAPNLFQVFACGPCLTFAINHKVVDGVTVDARYKEGYLGFYVHHGATSPRAELAARWIQVRAVLPEPGTR